MPVWLYWVVGGVWTYLYSVHQQRQAALQSVDVGLLMIKSSSSANAAQASGTTLIQSQAGPLKADANLPALLTQQAQQLSVRVLAPDWLGLATAVQSAGYPVLANSIATLGMTLLENGQLNLT